MQIKYVVRNNEAIQKFIRRVVPYGAVKVALEAIAEYLLGDESHGLRHAPAYKYVTRKKAYGQTFSSDKQRRRFWANGGPAMIGNHRTGATQEGWKAKPTNNGYGFTLTNSAPGAYWTMSDRGQANQPRLAGWRKASEVVASNLAGAMRAGRAAVAALIRNKGQ